MQLFELRILSLICNLEFDIHFSPMILFLLTILTLLYIFYSRPFWGVSLVTALAFFHEWQLDLSQFSGTRSIPFLSSLNAPVVDFVALVAIIALVISYLTGKINWRRLPRSYFYIFGAYFLYLIFAGISALGAFDHEVSTSLKFLARAEVFVFLAYLAYPLALIDSEMKMQKISRIMIGVGLFSALFGVVSVLVNYFSGIDLPLWRITPISFWGFAPFGSNHNLLAEALIVTFPFALWPALRTRVRLIQFVAIVIALVALLTLSRAAWLAFFVICAFAIYEFRFSLRDYYLSRRRGANVVIAVVAVVVGLYMAYFLTTSSIVSSSNFARFEVTRIALFYTARAPLIGHGPGMFIPILTDTAAYGLEFGDPLESHGFMQKILLENGILGLALFLIFIYLAFRAVRRDNFHNWYLSAARASAAGIVVFELFNTSYFTSVMFLPLGLMLAAGLLYEKN